jgi:hypothetical protein
MQHAEVRGAEIDYGSAYFRRRLFLRVTSITVLIMDVVGYTNVSQHRRKMSFDEIQLLRAA